MLFRVKFILLNYISKMVFGKTACIFWGYTTSGLVGFLIAIDKIAMNDCINILVPELQKQLKRVPAKVIPFRKRGEEVCED